MDRFHSGSLAVLTNFYGCRSMALRLRFSPGLPLLRVFVVVNYRVPRVDRLLNGIVFDLQDCKNSMNHLGDAVLFCILRFRVTPHLDQNSPTEYQFSYHFRCRAHVGLNKSLILRDLRPKCGILRPA